MKSPKEICEWWNNWNSTLERIKLLLEIFFLIGAIAGVFVGVWALKENRNANRLTLANQLYAQDAKLYDFMAQDPCLHALWAEFSDTNALATARKQVLILASTNNEQFSQFCTTNIDPLPWKTVGELYDRYVYRSEGFYDEKRIQLRKAYNFAENILYEVDNAYNAKNLKCLKEEDFQTWVAYTDALGMNPIFLTALQYGHDYAFLSEDSCSFFQERISSLHGASNLLQQIYPELLTNSWRKPYTGANSIGIGCRVRRER